MIRPATREDAEAVAGVNFRGWTVGYAGFLPPDVMPVAPDARAWRERLEHAEYRTLVWEDGGAVRGFVSFGPTEPVDQQPEGTGIVLALYVDDAVQGRGAGGALLHAAEEGMRAQGMHQAILWAFVDNAHARAFYEHRGWVAEPDVTEPHDSAGALELRYRRAL